MYLAETKLGGSEPVVNTIKKSLKVIWGLLWVRGIEVDVHCEWFLPDHVCEIYSYIFYNKWSIQIEEM